jgi:aminodeoxyfutalosine synthase
MSDELSAVGRKLADGVAFDHDDHRRLATASDFVGLGMLADEVRRRRHGDRATYVQVARVAWDEAVGELPEAGEIRLVGEIPRPETLIQTVAAAAASSSGTPVTGGDLMATYRACDGQIDALGELLGAAAGAGLAALSEVALDDLLSLDDQGKAMALLEAVGASGLRVNRIWAREAAVDAAVTVFTRVADWGTAAAVFRSLAPLSDDDPMQPSTGYADLRQVALARLLVDNIDSIQVDWSRHGPKLAQVALTFGADDLDAVPVKSGDQGWRRAPREEVRRNIVAAGYTAVRRNGRFEAS